MTADAASAVAPSRREIRRAENAEAIMGAAVRLVAEKGDDFTTQDLIKEAGVALQTFYRHFGGKDQLLLAVIAEMIAQHCVALEAQGELLGDPVAKLRLYVTASLLALEGDAARFAPFITSQHWRLHQVDPEGMTAATKPFSDLVQHALEEASEAGVLTPRDPERDAWLITKMVLAAFHHYAFFNGDVEVAAIADDVWRFCFAAVGGEERARRRPLTRRRR